MKKFSIILVSLLVSALTSFAFAETESTTNTSNTTSTNSSNTQTMRFVNERGSVLNLSLQKTGPKSGTITGTFNTAVSGLDCQDIIGKDQPIKGSYTGNAIAFTVSYPGCGAVIAIVGNFDESNNIETLFIDAHQGKHVNGKDWNTRLIGHDFYKLETKTGNSQAH